MEDTSFRRSQEMDVQSRGMQGEARSREILLSCKGIVKSYNGPIVLDHVDFSVYRGEVHSLVGENGAGKSTLIKIITGATNRNEGDIIFDGKPIPLEFSRRDAQAAGIACIYQELSLIPGMTVAQNIFLGKEPLMRGVRIIDKKAMNRMAQDLIDRYQFPLKATTIIDDLSIAHRQLAEILKALSDKASLMIMDEPTSSLTRTEVEMLFKIIHMLRDQNISVLYVSHRMEEVYHLSDRVTVLRDGKLVDVLERDRISPAEIIRLMIGHKLEEKAVHHRLVPKNGPVVLEVRNITSLGKFEDISFDLHEGEILGIGGLVGAGRTELVRALYGIDPIDAGTVRYLGKPYVPSVQKAIASGIGFIPEERRRQGILPTQTIRTNIAITNLDVIAPRHVTSRKREQELAMDGIKVCNVKPADPLHLVGNLSGGNQQKVVLAKWLVRNLRLLFIDEPTVGIDIGAKEEIYEHIQRLAASGVSIILVSSDLPELTRLSDRVLVLRKGRIIKEFKDCVLTGEKILRAASGITEEVEDEA
ncbi:MAG: sugar ABC transporter ATP-binding protein [Rectinemataceae bacterium]|nr:sugar ABC transporter ATP-binding protein [Spirochaetaceae bacterium]